MFNFHSPCAALFICSAILCWNKHNFTYSFTNFTRCTLESLDSRANLHLIFHLNKRLQINEKAYQKGFICSSCQQRNFREFHSPPSIFQCHEQRTRIQLNNYCRYFHSKSPCQCISSKEQIEFPTDWTHALIPPGKSAVNANRYLQTNQSASVSLFFFLGLIVVLILFGGMISMIFYSIKLKTATTK